MRLLDLEPHFVKLKLTEPLEYWPNGRPDRIYVESLRDSDGVEFLCPRCYQTNNGSVGTHLVGCWWSGKVPDWVAPRPGRWNPSGNSLDDLTFVPPGLVSVQINGGCNAHFVVAQGEIKFV